MRKFDFVTYEQLDAIWNANEQTRGTLDYNKYSMCCEYKYKRDGKWTNWKFIGFYCPTVGGKYYFKKVNGKLYMMRDLDDSVERYEVTSAVKELLSI